MKITQSPLALNDLEVDLLLLPVLEAQTPTLLQSLAPIFGDNLHAIAIDFKGKKGQTATFYPQNTPTKRLFFIGLGDIQNAEHFRRQIVLAKSPIEKAKAEAVGLVLPESSVSEQDAAQAFVEGLMLATYQYQQYKTDATPLPFNRIVLQGNKKGGLTGAEKGRILAEATCFARDLINLSPNEKTPLHLAKHAKEMAKKHKIDIEIWDKARIEHENFGGLLAVNKGSQDPPAFMVLEYQPENHKNKKPIVLVGKGVVFDTGGLSLKPTKDSMDHMKADMSGAAAVLGTMQALSKLALPLHVIALVPATDNRPGERAYVPGDVIKMHNGKTVEVLNTDAEGRMILADALSYAQQYDPELVVDIATLTGAQVVALGNFVAAVMANEDETSEQRLTDFVKAGKQSGDWVAPLPMDADFAELLKSSVADLKNIGGAAAGTISAGKFLEHFTNYPWVHIDIAGPAFLAAPRHYHPVGGTGFGVRLLTTFLMNYAHA